MERSVLQFAYRMMPALSVMLQYALEKQYTNGTQLLCNIVVLEENSPGTLCS